MTEFYTMPRPKRSPRKRNGIAVEEPTQEDVEDVEDEDVDVLEVDGTSDAEMSEGGEEDEEIAENGDPDVDEALWDAFREEFHEIIEQLPLYLHRSYTLLHELDEHAEQHAGDLLRDVRKYTAIRQDLARSTSSQSISSQAPSDGPNEPAIDGNGNEHSYEIVASTSSQHEADISSNGIPGSVVDVLEGYESYSVESGAGSLPPANTTRILLPRIVWSADEFFRTSEEKTSLAQTIYDSVQRHIRQLDQAIKEQEISISMGMRQGTHPALLEDLTVPRWQRQPVAALESPADFSVPSVPNISANTDESGKPTSKKGRKGATLESFPSTGTGLRLRLKPPHAPTTQQTSDSLAEEELYCICHQPSTGTMVACDNVRCQNGIWFHLVCMGLAEGSVDKTKKWYCPTCEPLFKARSKRRRR